MAAQVPKSPSFNDASYPAVFHLDSDEDSIPKINEVPASPSLHLDVNDERSDDSSSEEYKETPHYDPMLRRLFAQIAHLEQRIDVYEPNEHTTKELRKTRVKLVGNMRAISPSKSILELERLKVPLFDLDEEVAFQSRLLKKERQADEELEGKIEELNQKITDLINKHRTYLNQHDDFLLARLGNRVMVLKNH
jgi:chromosome segregation ATPase